MAVVPQVKENIGYTYAGAHKYYALDGDIVFQIAAKYPQHKEPRLARRRFVYYWETDFKKSAWVRHGLAMTDDDGFLFDLKSFFNDHVDNRNLPDNLSPITEWKIKKFDHEKRAWVEKKWGFFGGIEDTIAFQKWVGLPHLCADTRENVEDGRYFKNTTRFVRLDENDQPIFRYHFLAPEKYLLKFRPGRKRFFMFCPPDIIDPLQCKQKGQKQQPSSPVVQSGGSNRTIDFEFMPEPLPAWEIHKYYVKKDETMSDIVEKYNETLTRFHKRNEKLLGNNPHFIKEGWALEVPGNDTTKPFGTPADERYIFETIADNEILRVVKFPIKQESGRTLHSARMLLATNLEEHLSNLAFHTCLLDMEYQQVVESSKPFIEASAKVRQMGDLLELMYTYPGYKKRVPCPGPGMYPVTFSIEGDSLRPNVNENSVYYEGPVEVDEKSKRKVYEASAQYHQYADELSEAVWNDNNPVFATEKDDIYREIDIIEDIVTSPAFYRRLDEWVGYSLYGTEKGDYPYFLKHSCNAAGFGLNLNLEHAPIVYRVIQDAFCLMLSMDLAQRPGKSEEKDTVAEAFYKRAVAPFEADLELEYLKLDAVHNVGAEILKLCKMPDVAILKPDADKSIVQNEYWLNVLYSKPQATVLQIVFEKALFKQTVRRMDTYYKAIGMLSARCRVAMILSETNTVRAVQAAFSYLKVEIGKLILAGADKQSITLELEQGAKEFARIKAANARRLVAGEIGRKGMKAPAVPEKLKVLTAGFGFAYLLYESALFYVKCTDGKEDTFKDWYDFAKVMNTGGLWLAKFDPGWTKRIPVLREIEQSFSKNAKNLMGKNIARVETYALKPLQAYFMIIDAQIGSFEALNYYEDGEELLCGLRAAQAAFSVIAAMGVVMGLPIISAPISVVLQAVGYAGMLGTELARNIILMLRKGVENTVKDTRAQLNRMPLFEGQVSTFSDDSRYVLYNALTFVMERQTWHSLTPALKKWRTAIEPIDESISWWNLDMIRAGSALRAMGYSPEQIAFICMEIQEPGGYRPVERDWIQYFAENETFCIKQRKEPLRQTQNGEITVEPKGIEEYRKAFVKRGDRLEITALSPRQGTTPGLFQ